MIEKVEKIDKEAGKRKFLENSGYTGSVEEIDMDILQDKVNEIIDKINELQGYDT